MSSCETTNGFGFRSGIKKQRIHPSLNGVRTEAKNKEVNIREESSTTENMMLESLSDNELMDDEETGLTGREQGTRRQKSRRSTLLDHTTVYMELQGSDVGKKQADFQVLKKILINGLLITSWYIFSLFISIVR